jgi:hypothetical protein
LSKRGCPTRFRVLCEKGGWDHHCILQTRVKNPKRQSTVEPRPSKNEGWAPVVDKIECMCRNIKTLFNFDPPVTDEEVRAASLQFVRKISGFSKPSKANEEAFLGAIEEIAGISSRLLRSLATNAPPKNREEEAAKAKARAAERFGT